MTPGTAAAARSRSAKDNTPSMRAFVVASKGLVTFAALRRARERRSGSHDPA
jgi:hypothetical protein